MITVLTGGTGGAKFVDGLRRIVSPKELTVIVNTGDDHEWWGLYVSPDLDSIMYMMAGILSPERGWGVRGDTFHCLQTMKELGEPSWFSVGDRDLAIHLLRTKLLSQGCSLSESTQTIAEKLRVHTRILPMSDHKIETRVQTPLGELSFEEYFVKRRFQDPVSAVRFAGAADSNPAPGVLEAIANADAVLIAPSNPITSIGPILSVLGIRDALRETAAKVVAVSPIVGTAAVSGPAAALMASQGFETTIAGIVDCYADFIDGLIVDHADTGSAQRLIGRGVQIESTNIFMRTAEDRIRIARTALKLAIPELATANLVEAS